MSSVCLRHSYVLHVQYMDIFIFEPNHGPNKVVDHGSCSFNAEKTDLTMRSNTVKTAINQEEKSTV